MTQTPPLDIQVTESHSVEEIVLRTKSLLEMIAGTCDATGQDDMDHYATEKMFTEQFVTALGSLCWLAARDLANLETSLSNDGPDVHRDQVEDVTVLGAFKSLCTVFEIRKNKTTFSLFFLILIFIFSPFL